MHNTRQKAPGKYGWEGACAPGRSSMSAQNTFSVGIFEWKAKARGGVKKSAVVARVKGAMRDAEKVYAKANELCDILDAGGALGKKIYSV